MEGDDGKTHSLTVQASSVFDAAQQGISAWAMFWWYRAGRADPGTVE
jgi:hypothetical protein